jgi:hypothetical protein
LIDFISERINLHLDVVLKGKLVHPCNGSWLAFVEVGSEGEVEEQERERRGEEEGETSSERELVGGETRARARRYGEVETR